MSRATRLMSRSMPALLLAVVALSGPLMGPANATKVYVNPSIQTNNVSPDGTYNEGYSMQDVASRLMTKLSNRGFEARNSAWLSLSGACTDAVNWGANSFVALHTNAVGSSWGTAHGTEGYYYTSSSGWYDPVDRNLADRCVHKCVEKFNAWGRGYDRGTFGDYPRLGFNLYVLSHTPGMNSVLVEGLFHDNYDDTQVLKSASGKDAYAQAIYEAVCDFYGWSYSTDVWDSAWNAQSYTSTMSPGQQAVCWVEYRNTGNTTWNQGGSYPVHLGTSNPQDRSSAFFTSGNWINAARPTEMDTATCAPNEIERFSFVMTAPSTLGYYQEYWRLVAENKAWFGYSGTWFGITVINPKGNISGKITNATTGAAISGALVTLNTGASTSTNGSGDYSFSNLDPATYTVTASAPSYSPNSGSATVTAGNTTTRNIALTPTDTEAPSVPEGLAAAGIDGFQIQLSWNPSTDNVGVAGYRVFRNGTQVGTTTGTSYTDTGLNPMTTYSYQVSAYDAVGNQSARCSAVDGSTLSAVVAVFTDGFGDLSNWQGDPDALNNLAIDNAYLHNTLPGANSAKATAGQARFMYHPFVQPFATGKYEAWFYDTSTSNSSRQGIHVRGYNQAGGLACSFYLGTYSASPGSYSTYSAGVYTGSAWMWSGQIQTRSVGWHKFAIEVLPYTGSGDVKFYIDDALKATMDRPANSNAFGFSRIHIGHNYNVNQDGWYDDVAFYSQAPNAPAIGDANALSAGSIRWGIIDQSDNEAGFRLLDGAGNATYAVAQANLSYIDEPGLAPNTSYTRKVQAFNGTLNSWPSDATSRHTLSAPPTPTNVTCGRSTSTWYADPTFVFTAVGGFGPGTVEYYRWVFDQNPTHTWDGTEPVWNSDNLVCTAASVGDSWYLHVQGFNAEDIPNGTADIGPYFYGSPISIANVNAGSLTETSAVITWDTDVPASSQVEYGLTVGYGSSTPLDSNLVTSHSVSLSGLTQNTTYHFRVKSTDSAGHAGSSGDFTFTTVRDTTPPGPPTNVIVLAPGVGGQLNISWARPGDSDFSYVRIYRSTASGALGSLVYDNETGTSRQDTGLTDGTTYYYTLRSVDHAGNESVNTDQHPGVPTNPLNAPAYLNATPGSSTIALSWGSVSGAGSYNVYRATISGGQGTTPLASGLSTTSYTDNAVTNGTTYYYIVRAVAGTPGPASPEASAMPSAGGQVAIFTDGFDGSVNPGNWTVHTGMAALTYDGGTSHNSFAGAGSAKAPAGQSAFMYHEFPQAFQTGRYEAWFYDSSASNSSRQGIHIRAYSGTTALYVLYVGTYSASPGSYGTYSAGVYDGSAWDWSGQVQARSVGWHRFTIDVTASDVQFSIDGVVKATKARPANLNTFGINRIYLGYNYNVNQDGWFDDVAFYSTYPTGPTMAAPQALSTTAIRWSWGDNSNNESGFRLQDSAGAAIADLAKGTTSYDESGLAPNTPYLRHVKAWNGTLESGFSGAKRYTLSIPPSGSTIASERPTGTPFNTPIFNFTAVGGFGPGKVQYYRYAWDQTPIHTYTGTEPNWSVGNLSCQATADGNNWYLHLQGYNGEGVANGSLDLGPYVYDGTLPTLSSVRVTDLWDTTATIRWETDEQATDRVDYGLTESYGSTASHGSAMDINHALTLTGLTARTTYHFRVRSTDTPGNEAVSVDYTFQTTDPPPTFTSPAGFVRTGWNLVSIPATPARPDPLVVFTGVDVPNSCLQYWMNDVDGGGYQSYGELLGWTGPLQVGTPYWFLHQGSPVTLFFAGRPNTTDFQITIPEHTMAPYWVMIGHPFNHATLCSDVKFSSVSTPIPQPWPDAYASGIVESTAAGFEPATHSFFGVGPGEFMVDRDRLEPWYGYWLLVRTPEPVTITIPVSPPAP